MALGSEVAEEDVRAAIRLYVGNELYLKRCRAGKDRIGLDGAVSGAVTEKEQSHAHWQISQRLWTRAVKRDMAEERRMEPEPDHLNPDGKWARKPHPANTDKPRLSLKSWRRS